MPHPLIAAELERRDARLADIELGLSSPRDRPHWHDLAKRRLRELQADQMDYGLMPHEQDELERLKQLVGIEISATDLLAGLVAAAFLVAMLVACTFWQPV